MHIISASTIVLALSWITETAPVPQDGWLSSLSGMITPSAPPIGRIMTSILPRIKFNSRTSKPPEVRPDAKRTLFRYGPVRLAGKNEPKPSSGGPKSMDKYGQTLRGIVEGGLCRNCTVLYGLTGVQNSNGSAANDVYVHHFLALDISKKEARAIDRCPSGSSWLMDTLGGFVASRGQMMGAGFIGQGDDNGDSAIWFTPSSHKTTSQRAVQVETEEKKFDGGFHMGASDEIMVVADLVNYSESARDVYLTFDLEYLDGIVGQDATSELLSVGGCSLLAGPKVAQNRLSITKSPAFKVLEDGYIVSAKGHMHDGGVSMKIYVNDKEVCVSEALYKTLEGDSPGGINGMSRCGDQIPVKKGDNLVLESSYDLTKHPTRKDSHGDDAHGMMDGMDYMGMWALSISTPRSITG